MVQVPATPPSERFPGRPAEGRVVVIAPTRAACETIELGVQLTGVETVLEREHGPEIRELATRVDVMRWGHAMVRPLPRFVWSDARRDAAQPHGAIHFANTDLSGIALCEEALHHGVRAAEEVLGSVPSPRSAGRGSG